MISLVLFLIGTTIGMLIGIISMFIIMGSKLRDQFIGRNQENKPIVIEWLDGFTKDFQIMMHGVPVFIGVIRQITLQHDNMSGQSVHIEIMSKASEVMRVFRT